VAIVVVVTALELELLDGGTFDDFGGVDDFDDEHALATTRHTTIATGPSFLIGGA
jgi:hypothetical protein